MSSPRKYSSPYLLTMPGLPTPTKASKKRSKTSIKAQEPVSSIGEPSNNLTSSGSQHNRVGFDASCGDMDLNTIESLKVASKSLEVLQSIVPSLDPSPDCCNDRLNNAPNEKIESVPVNCGLNPPISEPCEFANIHSQPQPSGSYAFPEITDESAQLAESDSCNDTVLKSILKKPSLHKTKLKIKLDPLEDAKKPLRTPKPKYGKPAKESNKDNPSRGPAKQKSGAGGATSVSKIDLRGTASTTKTMKSPRKKSRIAQDKPEEKTGNPGSLPDAPSVPKKAVRFSNNIEVYTVPYESRGADFHEEKDLYTFLISSVLFIVTLILACDLWYLL